MSARLKDMFNRKSVKRVLIGISAIALTACVLIMLPAVERLVIRFVEENLLHRTLGNPEYWLNYLFSTGYVFFMPAALLLIFLLAGKNPSGCLCLLIICFVLNMFLYKLFSAGRGAHDRLRFPLFVLLLAVIIHIVRNHGLFNQITDRLTKICGKITKSKIITGDVFVFICGGLIGAVFFIFVFGTIILDFTYTDWLMAGGDLSQHYLGWRLFRSSSWYFPFGLMDNIVYPFKESIIYTDSIPLFAVIFKMFSPVLPENFQYFGLFGIICYTLQGGIGAMLIRRIGGGAAHAIIGSVFFVLSTVMMQRIYGHTSLSAHFIILLMILACLKKPGGACKKDVLVWSGLICLAAMIHIYFVPMVIIFMCFYILRNCLILKNPGSQLLIAGIPAAMLFIVLFCFGAFYSHVDAWDIGLGAASANLNAFVNPQGISRFIKDLPLAMRLQYEGQSYMGLGIITAVIMILSVQLYRINGFKYKELFSPLKKSPYVLGILLSFLLFALSPVVTFNQYKLFSYPILPPVEKMWSVFRSTGRYTWPIIYICILFCVWWIVKNFSFKKGILVLSFLVILQGVDLKDYFMSKGGGFKAKKLWHTELESPVWPELAKTHKHIFFLDGYLKLYSFLDLATNNNMTVNDAYLARKNSKAIYDNKRREIEYLAHGGVKQDTLYVFASKERAALLGFEAVYLYSIDNVIVGISSRSDYLNEYALDL